MYVGVQTSSVEEWDEAQRKLKAIGFQWLFQTGHLGAPLGYGMGGKGWVIFYSPNCERLLYNPEEFMQDCIIPFSELMACRNREEFLSSTQIVKVGPGPERLGTIRAALRAYVD